MALATPFTRASLLSLALAVSLVWACGDSGGTGDTSSTPPPPPPSEPAAEAPSPAPVSEPLGTSAVAGTVTFEGSAPRLKAISMDADPACAAKHDGPVPARFLLLGEGQTLGNVFVQVKNPPEGNYAPPAEPAIVDQRGCLYDPHVLGIMAGQPIMFRNSDGLLHNVHGLPKVNREFNMGMPPTLTESDVTLKRPEPLFKVKCDVHPWMHTYVSVMSHPFFAVTSESGELRIEGLPAGTYEVEAWHERLGVRTASVTVGDGETGTADFVFTPPSKK